MKNPFADRTVPIDGNLYGKDIDLEANIRMRTQNQTQGVIDAHRACNGEAKYQADWADYFNQQRKRMITAADLYGLEKKYASSDVLDSLREDIANGVLLTSTRCIYDKNSLSGLVVHNDWNGLLIPLKILVAEIPVYEGENIKQVMEQNGLNYMRALFNTQDSSSKIIRKLEWLAGKEFKDINIWTKKVEDRQHTDPHVLFYYFGTIGPLQIMSTAVKKGFSRGVSFK